MIAVAVTAYEVENRGFLPRAFGGNPSNTYGPLNEPGDDKYYTDYLEDYMDIPDDQDGDFYLCPESTLEPGVNAKRLSYSAFRNLFVNRDSDPVKRVRVSDIKRPTEVIGFGDAAQQAGTAQVSGPNFTGGYVGPYSNPAAADNFIAFPEALNADGLSAPDDGYHFRFRHSSNTTANAGFIDGHAEPFTIGQVQEKNFATDY